MSGIFVRVVYCCTTVVSYLHTRTTTILHEQTIAMRNSQLLVEYNIEIKSRVNTVSLLTAQRHFGGVHPLEVTTHHTQ